VGEQLTLGHGIRCSPASHQRAAGSKHTLVKTVVQYFLDAIIAELGKGGRLEFRDFGVFETRVRAARTAQNPKTLTKVQVPTKRMV